MGDYKGYHRCIWNQKRTTGNINHNQCAFADVNDSKPFCYTTNRGKRWEHCNCKACDSGPKPITPPTQRPPTEGPPIPEMVFRIWTIVAYWYNFDRLPIIRRLGRSSFWRHELLVQSENRTIVHRFSVLPCTIIQNQYKAAHKQHQVEDVKNGMNLRRINQTI